MFSALDGVMLDGYDKHNETHKRLLYETRQVTGMGGFWHTKYWVDALEKNGFTVHKAEVLGGQQWELINQERWKFENALIVVDFLVDWGIIPKHLGKLMKRFTDHGESFTTMDKENMFTTNFVLIAELTDKPDQMRY